MFHFHWPSDDPQISSTANHQIEIPEDPMNINCAAAANPLRRMAPVQAALPPSNNQQNRGEEDDNCRKKNHRETEKQRRKEMASLSGALRSLLPLEFTSAGKRSIPDQINESVDYIRHLQSKFSELEDQRDRLKLINTSGSCSSSSIFVVITPWCNGVLQLLISQGLMGSKPVCPLSVVLNLLSQEGVQVFNSFTCRVEDRTMYDIQCEATADGASMDIAKLQQELEALLN